MRFFFHQYQNEKPEHLFNKYIYCSGTTENILKFLSHIDALLFEIKPCVSATLLLNFICKF